MKWNCSRTFPTNQFDFRRVSSNFRWNIFQIYQVSCAILKVFCSHQCLLVALIIMLLSSFRYYKNTSILIQQSFNSLSNNKNSEIDKEEEFWKFVSLSSNKCQDKRIELHFNCWKNQKFYCNRIKLKCTSESIIYDTKNNLLMSSSIRRS